MTRVVIRQGLIPEPQWPANPLHRTYNSDRGSLTCDTPHMWREFFPFDYETAFQILTRDLPGKIDISFQMSAGSNNKSYLEMKGAHFEYTRSLGTGLRDAGPGSLVIEPCFQGINFGRILSRNQIEFMFCSGQYDESFQQAGLDNGGYTWARFGLLPVDMMSGETDYQGEVVGRLRSIWPILTEEERQYMEPYTQRLVTPKSLWHIADAEFDVAARLHECSSDLREQIKRAVEATYFYGEKTFANTFARAAKGQRVTLGQFCLVGTTWDAYLNYHDPEQMQRIDRYTGGFKYIAFE